jgi:hypothetical protein
MEKTPRWVPRAIFGVVVVVVLLATAASALILATRPTRPARPGPPRTARAVPAVSTTSLPPSPTTSTTTTTTTDPGTLPQTTQFPAADAAQFNAEMQSLWQGVVSGSVAPALPSFFPRSAYVQLKTGLAYPAADWQNRLVADFGLDIEAAHALLGSAAATATFQGVAVPEQFGHWIPPGVCANGIGYYEVANARVVYSLGGQVRSFGIASLISWRGTWYVVHLGAILRSSTSGVVDDPEAGPGTSAPSHTC